MTGELWRIFIATNTIYIYIYFIPNFLFLIEKKESWGLEKNEKRKRNSKEEKKRAGKREGLKKIELIERF